MNILAGFFEGTAALFFVIGALFGGFTRIHAFVGASAIAFIVFIGLVGFAFAVESPDTIDWVLVTLLGLYAWFCGLMCLAGAGLVRFVKRRREK